jgi:hypothetical protein
MIDIYQNVVVPFIYDELFHVGPVAILGKGHKRGLILFEGIEEE